MDGVTVALLVGIAFCAGTLIGDMMANRHWQQAERDGHRRECSGKLYNVFTSEDAEYLIDTAMEHEYAAYTEAIHACVTLARQFAVKASQAYIVHEHDVYINQHVAAQACAEWIQRIRDGQEVGEPPDNNVVALGPRRVGHQDA